MPPAPRKPSERARDVVYKYQGTQSALRIVGIAFTLMGGLFTTIFCWGLPIDMALAFGGTRAQATVIDQRTQWNVKVNGRHPQLIHFRYEHDGKELDTTSSSLDSAVNSAASPGSPVEIEYLSAFPSFARIRGATYSTFGYMPAFLLLFPGLGLYLLRAAVRSNNREIRAFRNGTPILARVTHNGPDLSTRVNNVHPWKIDWEFQVNGALYQGSISHMSPTAIEDLVSGEKVIVLYDPKKPEINTVYVA